MRPSRLLTAAAVLRTTLGKRSKEWAQILGCSADTLHSIESGRGGRYKLSPKMATKMFHETGISIDWLLAGDPKAPPVAANGEPYTRKIYDEIQEYKLRWDQPHEWYRHINELGFCAQLVAILENANAQKKYYMAAYEVGEAIKALRKEFAKDLDPGLPSPPVASAKLKPLIEFGENFVRDLSAKTQKKPTSSRRRSRRA